MKVFIITESGKKIGFGHLSRCIALYQAFEEKGLIPELIINGEDSTIGLIKAKRYHVFNWLSEKKKLFKMIQNADVGIIDSYLADLDFMKEFSNLLATPVYIDDNKRLNYPKGIVINGALYAERLNYPRKKNNIYLLGSQFTFLRKEFWQSSIKKVRNTVENILVTFGGSDPQNMTASILRFLNKEYPKLKKNVIINNAFQDKHKEEIYAIKDEAVRFFYAPDAGKMREIMIESDLSISAGGQTLNELSRIGVPSIVVCVADNQLFNLNGWTRAGASKFVGRYDDVQLLEKIRIAIKKMDYATRLNMSRVGRRLIDGKGAARIIKEILSYGSI